MPEDLETRLAAWYEVTRQRCHAALIETGTELVEQTTVASGYIDQDRWPDVGWGTRDFTMDLSVMRKGGLPPQAAAFLIGTYRDEESRRIAATLVDTFGDRLPYSSISGAQPDIDNLTVRFDENPITYVELRYLVTSVRYFLAELERVDIPDTDLALRIAHEVVVLAARDTRTELALVPVSGLALDTERVDVGAATVRRLTDIEMGALMPDRALPPRVPGHESGWYQLPVGRWFVHPPTHMVEVRNQVPKIAPRGDTSVWRISDRLLVALQLLGVPLASAYAPKLVWEPRWVELMSSGGGGDAPVPKQLPKGFAPADLSAEVLSRALSLEERLRSYDLRRPETHEGRTVHRCSLAMQRDAPGDRIVDAVTALEGLLLRGEERGELSYKFRLNGALWLGTSPSERHQILTQLKDLYNVRSRLVHGGAVPSEDALERDAAIAVRLAGAALVRALTDGFPLGPHDFLTLALGGSPDADDATETGA